MDNKIRIFNDESVLVAELVGHSKGVISFSWMTDKAFHLLSGSWDGTALLWDIQTCQSLQKFGPHENGVHVLGLSNGFVATTSTGESVNGKPANFQLRFWHPITGQQVGSSMKEHTGSIRSIAALPMIDGFLTSGNDGAVIMRSLDGAVIDTVYHNLSEDGAAPFVLDWYGLTTYSNLYIR